MIMIMMMIMIMVMRLQKMLVAERTIFHRINQKNPTIIENRETFKVAIIDNKHTNNKVLVSLKEMQIGQITLKML